MYRILTCMIFLALGGWSSGVLAWDCSTITPSTAISPQNITISRDLPVGAVIGTQVTTPSINAFSCYNSDREIISNQTFGVKAAGTFDSMIAGRRVYKTGIDGVGYAISGSTTHCAPGMATVTGSNTIRGLVDTVKLCENTSGMVAPSLSGSVTVTFYKTAPETGSGTVTARSVGSMILLNNSLLWQSPEVVVNINAFTITTPACSVMRESIPVDMKSVEKKSFSGKGSTPGDAHTQSFSLPLACNSGTKVSIKMEGDIYDATRGVINTSGGNSAASGLGIQLLFNDQPMMLGTDVNVGMSAGGGIFTVPLKARYYQTGDRITPGTANGVLTFTMLYD